MTAHWLTMPPAARPQPDRVAALSGTLTLNLIVLGALLLPLARPADPVLRRVPDPQLLVEFVRQPVVVPVPPIPIPASVERRPLVPRTPLAIIPPDPAPIVDDAVMTVPAALPPPADPVAPVDSGPIVLPSDGLAYEKNPPPQYPAVAMRKRWEGIVLLRVLVGADGAPLEVAIERSSGRSILDAAARRKVLADWRFRAALRDGAPVQAWGLVPISFSLTER